MKTRLVFTTKHMALNLSEISFTFVQYSKGDKIGHLLAYTTLFPIFIMVGFATLLIFHRSLKTFWLLMGQLLNKALNLILKYLIKEPRPQNLLKDGSFGMPSSHSQFIGFFCTFGLFYCHRYGGPDKLKGWEWLIYLALVVSMIAVPYSRVYLNYHTTEQVLVGSLVGSIFGYIWYLSMPIVYWIWPYLKPTYVNRILNFSCLSNDPKRD